MENKNNDRPLAPQFPRAIKSVSREEFYGQDRDREPLELTIKDGETGELTELPEDLQGHLFIIAPTGAVDSPKHPEAKDKTILPAQNGWTPLLTGDGMIYRLDFHQTPTKPLTEESSQDSPLKQEKGKAWLASRLVKTPSYYADRAIYENQNRDRRFQKILKFRSWGIARLSVALGSRNTNNTALLPFKLHGQSERLLVTADVGRPWEIDPYNLKLIAPVGSNKDWLPLLNNKLWESWPFPPIMTSAHPVFDAEKQELFTSNVIKSVSSLLNYSRILIYQLTKYNIPGARLITRLLQIPIKVIDYLLVDLLKIDDCVYVVRWDGNTNNIQKWKVLKPNGKPAIIRQTLHQIGLTEKYIVFADNCLKIELDDFIPDIKNHADELENFLRNSVSYPQAPQTNLYIIPRDRLNSKENTNDEDSVVAYEVQLPEALVHYVVDYQNPENKIILHTAHMNAWDTAEFLHRQDRSVLDGTNRENNILGMVSTSTDVNRLVSYVIDPINGEFSPNDFNYYSSESGLVKENSTNSEAISNYPWSIAFYAYREDSDHKIPEHFQDIYWNSWGLWGDLMTDFLYNMYKNYKPRIKYIEEVCKQAREKGIPSELFRVKINPIEKDNRIEKIEWNIADRCQFPDGYFGTSAQFIPREGKTGQTEGYIVCIVLYSDALLSYDSKAANDDRDWSKNTEIWIFDAEDLSQGESKMAKPKYKLSHPKLNFGFTAHTTWLKEIQSPQGRNYDIREDFQNWFDSLEEAQIQRLLGLKGGDIEGYLQELKHIFEQDVYPHFETDAKSESDS